MSLLLPAFTFVLFIIVPIAVWVGCFAMADRAAAPLAKTVWRGTAFLFAPLWFVAGLVTLFLACFHT